MKNEKKMGGKCSRRLQKIMIHYSYKDWIDNEAGQGRRSKDLCPHKDAPELRKRVLQSRAFDLRQRDIVLLGLEVGSRVDDAVGECGDIDHVGGQVFERRGADETHVHLELVLEDLDSPDDALCAIDRVSVQNGRPMSTAVAPRHSAFNTSLARRRP